ncbi:MAG TPA: hypothetical protein VJU87_06415 [Gemmatimonadaceae bacterium]|nr:hypothetical protein [Gemmatimonadaceae bacterium]
MTQALMAASLWISSQAATLPDTIFTRQIASVPSTFERVTSIASGVLTLAILVFVVAAVPAAWSFRKSYKRVSRLLDRISGDVTPLMHHASTIAGNIEYVTTSVRAEVQRVNASIAGANERLQQAVALTERRLNEFNALLEVVQDEAERVFVSTASTVRGVRTGASALTEEAGPKLARRGEQDAGRPSGDADHTSATGEDVSDGGEHDSAGTEDDVARPRVRPRAARRGDEWGWA